MANKVVPETRGIDHIHVYVANRAAAQIWYEEVLGCTPVPEFAHWASDGGPLTLENPEKNVHLALFERAEFQPATAVAFGATGEGFLAWRSHLESCGLGLRVADHQQAVSMYFSDPDGNGYEVTTYDRAAVIAQI